MNNGDLLNKYLESARILIESTVSNMDTLGLETAYVASKLTQAVLTLQRTLLDVYHIFFDTTNNTQGSLYVYQRSLLQEINNIDNIFDVDKLHDTKDKCSSTEMRKIFDKWFNVAVRLVGDKSVGALACMKSATDVARLQQRIWLFSTNIEINSNTNSDDYGNTKLVHSYSQKVSIHFLIQIQKLMLIQLGLDKGKC